MRRVCGLAAGVAAEWVVQGTDPAARDRGLGWVAPEDGAEGGLAAVVRVEVAEVLALQVAAVAAGRACGIPEYQGAVVVVAQGQARAAPAEQVGPAAVALVVEAAAAELVEAVEPGLVQEGGLSAAVALAAGAAVRGPAEAVRVGRGH